MKLDRIFIVLLLMATGANAQTPLVDHHTHIISVNGSALTVEPLLSVIQIPAEFDQLLRNKEKFGGRVKDPKALADLYTKDALVLNPAAPSWVRGDRAFNYIVRGTEINHLLPTAFEINGNAGYVAGYEVIAQEYVSNFFYSLRKEADGKWRIAAELFTLNGPAVPKAVTAADLIKDLDAAGVRRAVVLSAAYYFGSRISGPLPDEYEKVRAENDWAAEQVSQYPDRLVGFCSFNPLKDYALKELDRCASNHILRGVKLHFSMSEVDLKNPEHLQKMRQVFASANRYRLPIIVHVRKDQTYGREHAEILMNQILPAAPDITVQIAHLWGGEAFSDAALTAYAEAVSKNLPSTKNLYFDVAEVELVLKGKPELLKRAAALMRQIGLKRILWGSDGPKFSDPTSWTNFRNSVPLTDDEFKIIASNVAPYLQGTKPTATVVSSLPQSILDLELQSANGERFKLADYQGNTIVLNFWATWCVPCKLETPMLVELQKEFRARGVRMIELSLEDPTTSAKDIQYWMDIFKVNYRVGWAQPELISVLLQGQQIIPQTFVIARDGRITKRFIGFSQDKTPPIMKQAIWEAIRK